MTLSPKITFSRISFRRQIMLLGIVVAVLLVAVIFSTFAALQYTRSAVLRDDQRRLASATTLLIHEYSENKPHNQGMGSQSLIYNESGAVDETALLQMTRAALRNIDGVSGGFYAAQTDALAGSSLPISPASDAESLAVSEQARNAVLSAARDAVSSGRPSARVLNVGPDIALVNAAPIYENGRFPGSAWTMMRLSNIPGTNRFRTYLIAAGLGIAALASVILTLFVVQALQTGVRKIEDGLKNLENSLSSQIPIEADPQEIRDISEAINRMASALKAKIDSEKQIEDRLRHAERLAALGRLIAGVAHEVRNPLATIRLRVQMCQASGDLEVRESCAVALQEIERLNGMVSRLLSFSRPVRLHTEPTSLDRLVEQRLSNFSTAARQHNIRLVTRFVGKPGSVSVDQNRLGQVFDNIIQNAIEAMSASGGTLCVSVARESTQRDGLEEVSVEFNDTGEGIPPEALNRIFDPFFTTKSTGTGLGLSICHELVQAHSGKIEITSAEGCGTTVRILLPVRQRAVAGNVA
jgi:signal transduction histidine kinase